MKMQKIAIICLAAAAMAACTKEAAVESSNNNVITISVCNELPGEGTKAALNGTAVEFLAGDAVSVFDGVANNKFTTEEGGAVANFTGTAEEAERYIVVSPYSENYSVNGSVVTYTIPEVQVAVPGGVDPAALVSAGAATDLGEVSLKNAVGLVKVVVPEGITAKEIQIAGAYAINNAICGQFTFNVNDQVIGIVSGTTSEVITLVPGEGQSTIAASTYYVAVRPKADYPGFTVAYVNENNELCKRQTKNVTAIGRNHILPVGEINTTDYTPVTGSSVLRFYGDEPQFTGRVKKLAGGSGTATAPDNAIKKIVFKAHSLYSQAYKVDANVVSNGPASTIQIHAFMKGDVLYVCSEAPVITLYQNSGNLFRDFAALESIEFNNVNAQAGASFEYMFRNDSNLLSVDFGDADFSMVSNMSFMFVLGNLQRVSFGNTATTSVTTMQSMFSQALNLRYLNLGKNFTLAPTINGMFNGTASSTTLVKDEEGHGMQCKLFASQDVWDTLTADVNADGVNATTLFNKNRFYFTVAE